MNDGEEFHRRHGRFGFGREGERQQIRDQIGEKGFVDILRPDAGEIGEEEIAGAEAGSGGGFFGYAAGEILGVVETESHQFTAVVVERSEEIVEHRQPDLVVHRREVGSGDGNLVMGNEVVGISQGYAGMILSQIKA